MDFVNVHASIDVIFGPMFSGKTTELMRRLNICGEAGYKVLYVNSELDSRDVGRGFSTHNATLQESSKIFFIKTKSLSAILDKMREYDVIGIDEAQFFPDLKKVCIEVCEKLQKKIIVTGLNGDFQRNAFGQIYDILPICDTIVKLTSFCFNCQRNSHSMTPALFSKRIVGSEEKILVGDKDMYVPVCRKCYND